METTIFQHKLWYAPTARLQEMMGATHYSKKHYIFKIFGQEWSLIYHSDGTLGEVWRWGIRRNDDGTDPKEFNQRNEALDYMYRKILKIPFVTYEK